MKKYSITFLIGLLIFGFGCGYFWFEIMNYDYINEAPQSSIYEQKEEEYRFEIDPLKKYLINSNQSLVEWKEDETLGKEALIKVTYYPDFGSVQFATSFSNFEEQEVKSIRFFLLHNNSFHHAKNFYHMIMEDLKHQEIHNYSLYAIPKVEVFTSKENQKYVSIDGIEDEFSEWIRGNYFDD